MFSLFAQVTNLESFTELGAFAGVLAAVAGACAAAYKAYKVVRETKLPWATGVAVLWAWAAVFGATQWALAASDPPVKKENMTDADVAALRQAYDKRQAYSIVPLGLAPMTFFGSAVAGVVTVGYAVGYRKEWD